MDNSARGCGFKKLGGGLQGNINNECQGGLNDSSTDLPNRTNSPLVETLLVEANFETDLGLSELVHLPYTSVMS